MERLMRILGTLTRWGLGLCALLLVLIALYVNLGRELIPLVAEYRAEVQAKAREALDMPLEIGSLEGRWSGMAPVLLAHDVTVGEGANALHLEQVRVVPDIWGSLLARAVLDCATLDEAVALLRDAPRAGGFHYSADELAVAERNASGGLKGEPIKLLKADAVDAGQAVGAARRLTSVENVTAVFGSYSSALSFAATQVTEMAGVPFFELGAVSDHITERDLSYVMRSNPTARNFAEGTITAITEIVSPSLKVDPKQLKVAIIHEDALYGTTIAGFQKKIAQEQGLNVVEVLPYSAKAVDLSSLILRLKGAQADVVLQTSYQNDTTLFFRQIREAGRNTPGVKLISLTEGELLQDIAIVIAERDGESEAPADGDSSGPVTDAGDAQADAPDAPAGE